MSDKERDKFKAIWLSHSSIGDFLKCRRLYYLKHIYKDVRNGRKFTIMTPALALGQIVHEVVEGLSLLAYDKRLDGTLLDKFETSWKKVAGEKGGFNDPDQEQEYKERGIKMLKNIEENPGLVLRKATKLKSENGLPQYWFSEEEDFILCGKVDWIEYLEDEDSIHIVDFKTGKIDEDKDSLQLPIYFLLASNLQKRKIKKASYWYLNKDTEPKEVDLPDLEESKDRVGKIASTIKLARQINHFTCKDGGCRHCYPFERVLKGEGKLVGLSEFDRRDVYILKRSESLFIQG